MVSIKNFITEQAVLAERSITVVGSKVYIDIDASKYLEEFFKQVAAIKRHFANADFTKPYSSKEILPPFFAPLDTLRNMWHAGFIGNGSMSKEIEYIMLKVYMTMWDEMRSVLTLSPERFTKEKSDALKKIFKTDIPNAVNKVMSLKSQEMKKSKKYGVEDMEGLWKAYHQIIKDVFPQLEKAIANNLDMRMAMSRMVSGI